MPIEVVAIESASGSRLSGWYIAGQAHAGAVLLMHGVRANRLEMVERARLLHREGLSVLLFDFQAHGESAGRNITFGYLESRDARAAFDYLRQKVPGEHVGAIGVSLGGAAAILASLDADAMVLEAVYASFDQAVENRLTMRIGKIGRLLAPMLTWQVEWRLGFDPRLLQPAARIARLHTPSN
jgi:alpha-beta hydrolase superfamily lysophospholipase